MKSFRKAVSSEGEITTPPGNQNLPQAALSLFSSMVKEEGPFPTLKETERMLIKEAMTRTKGNQTMAANMLGINRLALHRRVKLLNEKN